PVRRNSRKPSLPCFKLLSFFHDTANTDIYTLSLHDALPILVSESYYEVEPEKELTEEDLKIMEALARLNNAKAETNSAFNETARSEEHTSELQSRENLVCRLLLEKKKNGQGRPSKRET